MPPVIDAGLLTAYHGQASHKVRWTESAVLDILPAYYTWPGRPVAR